MDSLLKPKPCFTVGDLTVDIDAGESFAVGEVLSKRIWLPGRGMHKEGVEMPEVAALLRLRLNEPRRTAFLKTLPTNSPVRVFRWLRDAPADLPDIASKNFSFLAARTWHLREPAIDTDGIIVVPMVIASGSPSLWQIMHSVGMESIS
jgi:hypothetical protein